MKNPYLTKQPVWEYIGNYGDANPMLYGGYFVYSDKTGVYGVEAAVLEPIGDPDTPHPKQFRVYRFICDRCTFINGILSDNKFHPDKPAWFAKDLPSLAEQAGESIELFISRFTSENVVQRAMAWRAVGEYWGFDELDSYPITLTRKEVYNRYRRECYK